MPGPNRNISSGRKTLYYVGMALMCIGFLTFCSVFVTGCMNFGNFDNFGGQMKSSMARGFGGMAMIIAGAVMMGIGRMGWAGSGIVLDPKQARRDVEPWSRMGGGMLNDALEEANLGKHLGLGQRQSDTEPAIRARCRHCRALNDESARFCDQCGAEM